MSNAIFCPRCDQLLLDRPLCPACGWERPVALAPGAFDTAPLPLGAVLSGNPALFKDVIWYAASSASSQEAGTLISLHRGGTIVRRHELAAIFPPPARPVAETVTGDGHFVFLGLRDYAFGLERAPKPLLALEPRSGRPAWNLPTPSRELTPPVLHRGTLYLSGASPGAVYAVDPSGPHFRWQATVDVDSRFRPAVTTGALVVLAGPLVGEHMLTALTLIDGKKLWQTPAPAGAGQPLGLADLVVVPGRDALHAYDAQDGRSRWHYEPARATSRGVATAPPVLAGSRLLLATGAPAGYALDALDVATGERCWHFRLPGRRRIKVAPAVFGNTVVVGTGDGDLFALDLESGAPLWQENLPAGLAAVPVTLEGTFLLPARDGLLYRLAWHRTGPRPLEAPALLEERGDWAGAAAAHALADPPALSSAGRCLLRADQPQRALALFEAAGDELGAADALAAQNNYEAALKRVPADAPDRRADWLARLNRYDEAAALLASLERWSDVAAAYEMGGQHLQAVEAYRRAGRPDEVVRLIAVVGSAGVEPLVRALGWEAALSHYHQAGDEEAVTLLREAYVGPALQAARSKKEWQRVRELCQQLGDWRGEAEACLRLAEAVPRRELQVAASHPAESVPGLPPQLYHQLSAALRASDYFESQDRLRTLFADSRLGSWRSRLPDAGSIDERVQTTIELLQDQYNRAGDNGLLLLIRVLAERRHPDDIWHGKLETLSDQLVQAFQNGTQRRTEQVPLPEAYEWWFRAGEIFAAHDAWAEAEGAFRMARHHTRWAQALARQERWEDAADLLHGQKLAFDQAATYYWQAAQVALAAKPTWQERAPHAATLFQKAQECFLFCGNLEGLLLCRTEADRSLARARLLLGEGSLARPLQQGVVSRFTLPLYNVGFGPATDIQVWAYGNALRRERVAAAPVTTLLPVLVAGAETTLALTIEPRATAHETIPLEIDLLVRYRDVDDLQREEGPFAVHQPVLSAAATLAQTQPAPLRPYHEGTYFDTGEKVRIIRAIRETVPGPDPIDALLARLRRQLQEE